jgi:hypothetical protein
VKNKYSRTTEFDELVQIHVFSNDHEHQFVGNVVRWFERSTDEEIKTLLEGERNDAGHFTGATAQTVALELAHEIDLAIVLGYAKFQPDRYTVIVDKLTTSRWIRQHRPQLSGFLVPPELLRSLPAIVGEQPGVLFLDDLSSVIWDETTRVVTHFNFENELVREWKPGDDNYDSILDLFVQFPLPREED